MFISISSAKLIENSNASVLRACLQSFVIELENLFEDGYHILYVYTSHTMSTNIDVHNIDESILVRAILMNFTRDHLAQSKVGLLKGGEHLAYRRYNLFAYRV